MLALLCGVAMLAAAVLSAVARNQDAWVAFGFGLLVVPPAAVLGVVVARREDVRRVGLLMTCLGLAVAVTVLKETFWQALAEQWPDSKPDYDWLAAVSDQSAIWVLVAVALLLLHFPDGRVPSPRWRPVPWVLVLCAACDETFVAFEDAPFRPPMQDVARPWGTLPDWLTGIGLLVFVTQLVLVLACAVSLIGRHRRGDQITRARLKWLALAGLCLALYPPLCLLEIVIWDRPLWFSSGVALAGLVAIPVTTAVAMLRHDLYDIDKVLAGAVTYALVTAGLITIFAGTAFVGGLVLGRGSPGVAAAATALCAVALAPLRTRLQRLVDHRLYPVRRSALTAVSALARDAGAGAARPEELEAVLRAALRDSALRVGYRVPGTDSFVDSFGEPVPVVGSVPVELDGRVIGVLAAAGRPELLRQVATAAATLVEVVRLRLEVAQALREAESSRARLMVAGYEERRRLERDLHDGAQQRLASLGMSLRLAQRHLDDGTVDIDGLLDATVAELGTALAELRAIAYGLRPGRLDDGLDAALADLIRQVPVTVDLEFDADRLPDEIATTAYYLVSEAITNVVKHAGAQRIALRVSRKGGRVTIRISDDGRGGAILPARSGLADRVAALGGTLRVMSPVGEGTVIEAELPCAS